MSATQPRIGQRFGWLWNRDGHGTPRGGTLHRIGAAI